MSKRKVEVFTAGCAICEPVVQMVNDLACPDCEVTVYNLNERGTDLVERYGLKTVPAVVVDGHVAPCCDNRGPDREQLAAAGMGSRLSES